MRPLFRDILVPLLVALAIYSGFHATMEYYVIYQSSMVPNLVEGQRIFVNKLAYRLGEPERGDIIVFRPPDASPGSTPLIKRIIGLPAEKVAVEGGTVYINDVPLEEPYLQEAPAYPLEATFVPAEQYFVLGDNRNVSRDSRFGWTVERSEIVGKALFCVWPPGRWGPVPHYVYSGQQK
jgi:signal peptidase I